MGQLFSSVGEPSLTGPLAKLPHEILLLIASQLSSSPESLVALSLTCKALSSFFDTEELVEECRPELLPLLERDVGDRFYFCPACCQLHRFSQDWNPTVTKYLQDPKITSKCFNYRALQHFNPNPGRSRYRLHHVHVRLVTNRHLYGPTAGLSLESLARSCLVRSSSVGPLWRQSSCARIIGDELFLSITHTIAGRATVLREAIYNGRYSICYHIAMDPAGYTRASHRTAPDKAAALGKSEWGGMKRNDGSCFLFNACRDLPGSCDVCLTDYTTTIERAEVGELYRSETAPGKTTIGPLVDGWAVTIVSYHQIGRGRHADDWKWVALTKEPTQRDYQQRNTGREPSLRDIRLYPPGAIRRSWKAESLDLD